MLSGLFQQTPSSLDVGTDKRRRIHNGPVYMRFRSEIHHRVDRMLLKDLSNFLSIGDVAANEPIPRIFGNLFQVAEISCIRKQVQVEHFNVWPCPKDVSYETGTDKPGSTRDEKFHCFLRMDAELWMAACGISSAFASD